MAQLPSENAKVRKRGKNCQDRRETEGTQRSLQTSNLFGDAPSKGFSFQVRPLEIPKASDSSHLLKPLCQHFRHTDIVTVACLLEPEREKVGDMVGC